MISLVYSSCPANSKALALWYVLAFAPTPQPPLSGLLPSFPSLSMSSPLRCSAIMVISLAPVTRIEASHMAQPTVEKVRGDFKEQHLLPLPHMQSGSG